MSTTETGTRWRTQIPADIDRPAPLIAGLSARQLLLLAPLALAAWGLLWLLRPHLPLWALGLAVAPLVGTGVAVVAGHRDGLSLDALAWAGLRWWRAPKRRVGAPGGIRHLPAWAPTQGRHPALAPLRLPARAIGEDGTIDLGERHAVMVECSTLNLALASSGEQDAAIGAFAGVLHTLTEPAQILVRARRHDLTPLIDLLGQRAPALAHPDLEQAARDHAVWLARLQADRELLQRHLLLVLTATGSHGGGLAERAEDVTTQLGALGLRARVCNGEQVWAYLHDSLHPDPDPATHPGTDIAEEAM
ncbi:PrgI family protein [Streptomonospora litoralis]|uniref:PrgI family protein n=1 Tax=Streptomonospora litoralis TaxID=2498135 RepID=A0A4P6Q4F1_9ACTN|nr:PrgI family protein [Streptomonospora litoralis]QBI55463.1 PrgI family protein [Streptomonospora litoralis]